MELRVPWVRWEMKASVDHAVTLDPLDHQDLMEKR